MTGRMLAAVAVLLGCATLASAQEKVFKAGAATSNITPPLGAPIVGNFTIPEAKHIHDELHARCVVLDDGSNRLVLVLCDNVGIPREVYDAAKEKIEKLTKIPRRNQLMAATHTHSGPDCRGTHNRMMRADKLSDYQQFVADRIVDGVRRAINNLEPAQIAWGRAQVPQHVFNRRWFVKQEEAARNPFGGVDRVRMNPPAGSDILEKPAGPTDPEVAFLSLRSREGRPIALLANYSLHYVGGVPTGEISADYFGVFADRIQQLLEADRLQPAFVGILSNGTSGDINNIDFKGGRKRRAPYEQMKIVANDVAAAVFAAHKQAKFHDWVPLGARAAELELPVRKATDMQVAFAEKVLKKDVKAGWHPRETNYAERILQHRRQAPERVAIPLQTLRIGDLGIAALPFEVFAETGLELKKRSPFQQTFTIELANGSFGYLPPPRHFELGGYETWLGTSFLEADAVPKMVDVLLRQFKELDGAPGQ